MQHTKEHLQAIIAVSQGLASASHPLAIRHLGKIADHLLQTTTPSADVTPPLARRILARCSGQTLSSKSIALACGKSPGGSTIKQAIKYLVVSQKIQKIGAAGSARYVIPEKKINSDQRNTLADK